MLLTIGEILFDQFPDFKVIGGAPFNFSYHLVQLGESVRFVSRVGRDENGREILDFLDSRNFPVNDIQVDDRRRTGLVRVELSHGGVPSFNIVPDVAYDFIAYDEIENPPDRDDVNMIYFGSVIQRTDAAYEALHGFISERYPECKTFFDINLRPGCINPKAVQPSLQLADILKLNDDELKYLGDLFGRNPDADSFVPYLMDQYALESVALTLGENGSVLFTRQGRFEARPIESDHLTDTVGAGDAYAALIALGNLKGWPPESTIQKATEFAARICEVDGAIPDSNEFYRRVVSEIGFPLKKG